MEPCIDCGVERTRKNHGARGRCDRCNQRWRRQTFPEVYKARDAARWPKRREAQNARRLRYYRAHKEEHLRKAKEYQRAHHDELRAKGREYYRRNKTRILARDKIYQNSHKEYYRKIYKASHKRWLAKKPRAEVLEMFRAQTQRRMARKAAVPATLTRPEWNIILDYFGHRCAYCLRKMERLSQDHFIPLAKGGGYTADNIVPACKSCNSRKGDRDAGVYMLEILRGAHRDLFDPQSGPL